MRPFRSLCSVRRLLAMYCCSYARAERDPHGLGLVFLQYIGYHFMLCFCLCFISLYSKLYVVISFTQGFLSTCFVVVIIRLLVLYSFLAVYLFKLLLVLHKSCLSVLTSVVEWLLCRINGQQRCISIAATFSVQEYKYRSSLEISFKILFFYCN